MTATSLTLIDQVKTQSILGEGVIWHHERGEAWWVDIQSCLLFAYRLKDQRLRQWQTPERVTCMGFTGDDERLMVAFASGFAYYHLDSGELSWQARPNAIANTRFNDGRTDRQGRFWSGTMVEDGNFDDARGAMFCLDAGVCERRFGDLLISNGLCFSPDSKVMYHSDSPRQEIYAYDFDADTGGLGERRLFAKTDEGCYPDGACVDAEGYYYSAQWGGSRVVRYAPDGEVDVIFPMPVTQPSCVAFGGENLDLLIVTTAREDLSEKALATQPMAGDLLIFQTPFKGLKEPLIAE